MNPTAAQAWLALYFLICVGLVILINAVRPTIKKDVKEVSREVQALFPPTPAERLDVAFGKLSKPVESRDCSRADVSLSPASVAVAPADSPSLRKHALVDRTTLNTLVQLGDSRPVKLQDWRREDAYKRAVNK